MTRLILLHISVIFLLSASHLFLGRLYAIPLEKSTEQQRIVETVYSFRVASYKPNELETFDAKILAASIDSPERALLEYLRFAEQGNVARALDMWDRRGRALIEKKNANASTTEVAAAMSQLHKGMRIRFLNRMDANDYVVIQIEKQASRRAELARDWFALRREGGIWRLTQDLADDPIACCFHEKTDVRVRRAGVVGGDFRKMLEQLSR